MKIVATIMLLLVAGAASAGNCTTTCQQIGNQTYCNTSCY